MAVVDARRCSERHSDWVLTTNGNAPIADFSKPKGWLDTAMRAHLDGDMPHWQVHDIRRTVSTNLARLGIDPFVRRRVLNQCPDRRRRGL